FFFSSRRRHTRFSRDWSSDVCSSDLKWGVVGFSEALRKEVQGSGIRVSCVEPGFVETELQGHNDPPIRQAIEGMREQIGDILTAEDLADAILYVIARPPHVAINEVLIRPAGQSR